jgi:hypothetical protein
MRFSKHWQKGSGEEEEDHIELHGDELLNCEVLKWIFLKVVIGFV